MFGIECYVSNHGGFSGVLKTYPEDFLVTEISTEGRLASVNDEGDSLDLSSKLGILATQDEKNSASAQTEHPLLSSNEQSNIPDKAVESTSETVVNANKQDKVTERTEKNALLDHREQLASVLDDATLEKLDAFAARVLGYLEDRSESSQIWSERSKSTVPLESLPGTLQSTLDLGLVLSKDSRTIIHKSVRYLHPHLRTINHKVPDKNGLEVNVSVEPVVKELQELKIPLGQILPFIRFVESRAFDETFSFENLDCKDQRTKLHRLVAKHYGSLVETKTFGDGGASSQEKQRIVVRFRQKFKDHRKRRREEEGQTSNMQTFTGLISDLMHMEGVDTHNYQVHKFICKKKRLGLLSTGLCQHCC